MIEINLSDYIDKGLKCQTFRMDENKKFEVGNFYLTLKIAVFETKPH
jgi:hypothetical protein